MSLYIYFAMLVVLPQTDREPPIVSPPISLEDRLYLPYIELLQPAKYSTEEFGKLRSGIEHERDEKIQAARKKEKQWKTELASARAELEKLNRGVSYDRPGARTRRTQLHVDIAALERGIREKVEEHDVTIPAEYEKQLAKLWLIERWPPRREEILRRVDDGEGRQRLHGDVEDIGYRMIAKDPDDDIETGRQAVRQMMAAGWLPAELQDEATQNYVRRLANRIALHSDLKVPLHVTVVESGDLRPIALPGGFLYVPSGVLLATNSESEFAYVLSREIARIAARHAARASKKSVVSKMFLPIAQIATGIFSPGLNQAAYYGIGFGMQGLNGVVDKLVDGSMEKFQKEADQLGVQYSWNAGFDPRAGVEFLDSLEGKEALEFFSAAPILRERLLNLFSEIEYLGPPPDAISESADFQTTKERLRNRFSAGR